MCPPRTHRMGAGLQGLRQAGRVAGSFAEEAGDPAAGASGAVPVSPTGMSATVTRTPAVVGAEAPLGEPSPAPGPPQPPNATAVVGDGSWGAFCGAIGAPPWASPVMVVSAAGARGASASAAGAPVEGAASGVAAADRLWLAEPAA